MSDETEVAEAPATGDEPASSPSAASAEDDLLDDQADAAEDFLNGLLDILDLDGDAEADIEGETILVDVDGPSLGLLIGHHGATLEALQDLVRAAVQHTTAAPCRLVLDVAGYRERQREILERKVRGLAARVRETGRPIRLDPMSSFERRVVHQALTDVTGVATSSEGEDPDRCVVIRPV